MDTQKPVLAIVDDHQPFLDYLTAFLRLRSYQVRSYLGGRDIVAAFRAGFKPDLVLLDVMMPGMDGLETLKLLKEAAPAVPIIMLSSRNQEDRVVDAVRLGALDYLLKPGEAQGAEEAALDLAIKEALARLERVKELPTRPEAILPPGRTVRLDPDAARVFVTDADVNEALRRLIHEEGRNSE